MKIKTFTLRRKVYSIECGTRSPKVHGKTPLYILEPQAGQGNIVEYIREKLYGYKKPTIHAIEKDENLVAMLKGKDIPVIDRNFLTYNGLDKYDIIIANPPFSAGAPHLLKMIDIMYSGHIVCLLNAETLRNPCDNLRKSLIRKLTVLGADIEYRENCFLSAERTTKVEVAIVHIHIKRVIEDDLF